MNRICLLTILCFFADHACHSRQVAILDTHGALTNEEERLLIEEGNKIMNARTVVGQKVLVQIDLMEEGEFDGGGSNSNAQEAKRIFSIGDYARWANAYGSRPAVLMVFLKKGDGYALDVLGFTDLLMNEGIPDLVRRYIRDEIIRKEEGVFKMIDAGLYAIGEALNPVYKERLEKKGLSMLNTDKRYHRGYCVYEDWLYHEFYPVKEAQFPISEFQSVIDIRGLPDNQSTGLMNIVNSIRAWGYSHEVNNVSNWPWDNNANHLLSELNTQGYMVPIDYIQIGSGEDWFALNCIEEEATVGEKLTKIAWKQIHGWYATYCNFFAQDLALYVFGSLPWRNGMVANNIHEYIINDSNFVEIDQNDVYRLIDRGYISYFTQLGDTDAKGNLLAGHISTSWLENNTIIQAGRTTGIFEPSDIFDSNRLKIHVYLGFLKRK